MSFDEFSEDYDRILDENIRISGESSDYFSQQKLRVLDRFYSKNGLARRIRLLDVGCGIGTMERHFPSCFPEAKVYGVDPSAASVKRAASKSGPGDAVFLAADGKSIPFEDGGLDAILLSCVLHHIRPGERKGLLEECLRVLGEDGYLLVFEHNPFNPLTRLAVKTCAFDVGAHLLTKAACVNALKSASLRVVEARYTLFFTGLLRFLRRFEEELGSCPLGAQYFVGAQPNK